MFIPEPGSEFFPIPDPGSKKHKAPDPGSRIWVRIMSNLLVWLPLIRIRIEVQS